jgi:hypothetical protein
MTKKSIRNKIELDSALPWCKMSIVEINLVIDDDALIMLSVLFTITFQALI